MDAKVANSVFGYLETLYNVNLKLIKLFGMDVTRRTERNVSTVLDLISDIFRLLPYKKNEDKMMLDGTAGLLTYKEVFDFLENGFNKILLSNYDFIDNIRRIRNKYQHKMHSVRIIGAGDGSLSLFDFDFSVDGSSINLVAKQFIQLVEEMNLLYSKIQQKVFLFAQEKGVIDYPCYDRLRRIDFSDFSLIYKDKNLRLIGKLMHEF